MWEERLDTRTFLPDSGAFVSQIVTANRKQAVSIRGPPTIFFSSGRQPVTQGSHRLRVNMRLTFNHQKEDRHEHADFEPQRCHRFSSRLT